MFTHLFGCDGNVKIIKDNGKGFFPRQKLSSKNNLFFSFSRRKQNNEKMQENGTGFNLIKVAQPV
jgi:hypothetical protein